MSDAVSTNRRHQGQMELPLFTSRPGGAEGKPSASNTSKQLHILLKYPPFDFQIVTDTFACMFQFFLFYFHPSPNYVNKKREGHWNATALPFGTWPQQPAAPLPEQHWVSSFGAWPPPYPGRCPHLCICSFGPGFKDDFTMTCLNLEHALNDFRS